MNNPILYKKNVKGHVQFWQVFVDGDGYYTVYGKKGGKVIQTERTICSEKNVGKANYTSPEDQSIIEVKALIDKKLKEGYRESLNSLDEELHFDRPMKPEKWDKYKDKVSFPVIVQEKLNGVSCQIKVVGSKVSGMSNKGEYFYCIDHILRKFDKFFAQNPNAVLWGELYNPECKLNEIASLVSVNRKEKDISPEDLVKAREIVKYFVYDGYNFNNVTKDTVFPLRHNGICDLVEELSSDIIRLNESWICKSLDDVNILFQKVISTRLPNGNFGEGVIVREVNQGFVNKKDKRILKCKEFEDAEYRILDIVQGTGNWAGHAKKLVCELQGAKDKRGDLIKSFECNLRGSKPILKELLENKTNYIGKMATVSYQELSAYGVPLLPYSGLPFRDYEEKDGY